jgi:hypothetical protein
MDISQHHFGHKSRLRAGWLGGLVLTWALLAPGCLHLNEYDRLKFNLGAPAGPPPPAATPAGGAGWGRAVAGPGLALLGIALAGWRWRRLRRQGAQAQPVDREDLALIRTARDALVYLLRKRFTRLGVVALADFQRRRKARGP